MSKTSQGQTTAELHRIYRDLPVGLCYLDTDFRFIHINDCLAEINGFSVEEHIGRTIGELMPDLASKVKVEFQQVIETGEPIIRGSVEAEIPAQSGVNKSVEHSFYPVMSDDGEVIGISCIVEDITENRITEVALAKAHGELVDAIESIPASFILYDADGHMTRWNRLAKKLFYDVADLITQGTHIEDFTRMRCERAMPGASRQRVEEAIEARLDKFHHPGKLFQEQHSDGRWTEAVECKTSDGGTVCVCIDISERKAAEEAFAASQARLSDAIESMSDGFALFDADDRFVMCNANYHQIFPGMTDLLKPGARFEDIVRTGFERGLAADGDDADSWVRDRVEKHLAADGIQEYRLADGRWVQAIERRTNDGGIVCIRTDITRRKVAELELKESEAKFRNLIEGSLQGIVITNAARNLLFVNDAICDIFGYDTDEMLALSSTSELATTEDGIKVAKYSDARRRGEEAPTSYEFRGVRKDGKEVRLDALVTIINWDGEWALQTTFVNITERRRAEENARVSEEKYRSLIELLPDAILVQQYGKVIFSNSAAVKLYRAKSPDHLVGMNTIHLVHPGDRPEILKRRQALERSEKLKVSAELRRQRLDGTYFIGESVGALIPWNGGQATILVIRDRTERKASEDAVRNSERRTRLMADNVSAVIVYCDTEQRYRFVNKAFCDRHDLTNEKVIGAHFKDIPDEKLYNKLRPHFEKALKGHEVIFDSEIHYIKLGTRYLHTIFTPDFDDNGEVQGVFGFSFDVTERREADLAQRVTEARFNAIFEAANDAIICIDENGTIRQFNKAAEKIFGYSAEEANGQNVSILMPESDRSLHGGYLENYLVTGFAKIIGIGRKVEARNKDGYVFPIDLSISEVPTIDGRLFTAFIRDISERKKAEEQLHQAQKLEAVGQLTGGLAHDFNNILAVIKGNAQLLEMELKAGEMRDLVQPVIRATDRGADLTHRLLAFSRQQSLKPQPIDIVELCNGMIEMLRRTLGETIEIEIRTDVDLPKTFADPGQVENALLNLAINARDAMPKGGKITIETKIFVSPLDGELGDWAATDGEYVVLNVSDTGTGMPPHVLKHVFEPFFTTKEVGHGSGLGLSMIYGFAKQSGGHATIKSEEGRGTTVSLYLPKAEAAEMYVRHETADQELPSGNGENILVVEDDPDVLQLVVRQLERLGYSVREAIDGSSALDLLVSASRIDLILSDVVLPGGMSGIEIYARAGEHRSDLKCIFMSGYAEMGDLQLPTGACLLDKPVDYANLARTVRAVLDARAA